MSKNPGDDSQGDSYPEAHQPINILDELKDDEIDALNSGSGPQPSEPPASPSHDNLPLTNKIKREEENDLLQRFISEHIKVIQPFYEEKFHISQQNQTTTQLQDYTASTATPIGHCNINPIKNEATSVGAFDIAESQFIKPLL